MTTYVALHDRRLEGGVPNRPRLGIINTNETVGLHSAFMQIHGFARWGRIHSLFILCHGYAGENTRARVCMDAGGMGLELGKEDVLHANVSQWTAIKNKVENIVIYACGAGDTQRGNEGTDADGRYLMGALAIHTNATVYAADKIQWYDTYKGLKDGRFDFGDWEGQLWAFPSNGSSPVPVQGAPVEFSDVMSGIAA